MVEIFLNPEKGADAGATQLTNADLNLGAASLTDVQAASRQKVSSREIINGASTEPAKPEPGSVTLEDTAHGPALILHLGELPQYPKRQ